eukprot:7537537-Lingulodinium_polyedra.AAC.1
MSETSTRAGPQQHKTQNLKKRSHFGTGALYRNSIPALDRSHRLHGHGVPEGRTDVQFGRGRSHGRQDA